MLNYLDDSYVHHYTWISDKSTVEWCENNINMTTDASAITGSLSFDETPHLIEVLNDRDIDAVWLQLLNFSTQTGKTLAMLCCWAKAMMTDPTRMQWTIANKSDVPDYLDEKINPFINSVKGLSDKIIAHNDDIKKKLRAKNMNIAGGGISFTGTTKADMRSKSVKYMFNDEVALYEKGSLVELMGRTKSYERYYRKILAVSSRSHKNDEMDANSKTCETLKEWNTWCSKCDGYFYASSFHFKYLTKLNYMKDNNLIDDTFDFQKYKRELLTSPIYIECPYCKHKIDNNEKNTNILNKKYKYIINSGDHDGLTISYKVNALGVRLTNLQTIASTLADTLNDDNHESINQFYIDYFNEFYTEPTIETKEDNDLLLLGNNLVEWQVPENSYRIYMGVDSQKDHFWYEVKAYCPNKVSHTLSAGRVETFGDLEDIWIAGQELIDTNGNSHQISKMGIDRRGYNQDGVRRTDEVDTFVAYMVDKYKNGDEHRIYATQGQSSLTGDKPINIVNIKDYSNNRRATLDIKVINMSNLYLKNSLSRSIDRTIAKIKAPDDDEITKNYNSNLFYINQDIIQANSGNITSKSYIRQYNSEVFGYAKNNKTKKLDNTKSWYKLTSNIDNHLWDCGVICEAFAEIDKLYLVKPVDNSIDVIQSLSALTFNF